MKVRSVSTLLMFAIAVMAAATATADDSAFAEKEITVYPFTASAERATAVKGKYKRVTVGMSAADVKVILGEPDEVRPLYEPVVKNGKQIGYTYWYVIRRAVQHGSVNEKQEALVRVSFGLSARVTNVAHWGFENDNPSFHLTCYGWLRQPPHAGELKCYAPFAIRAELWHDNS